ncbi:MAG: leucine-rich repeat domain-containing protein [Peptococcaceae bacterium]|nr:leucine-rich repeat domain-containing protein [Peptococcaceae bacterium]
MEKISEFLANIDHDNVYDVLAILKDSKYSRIEKVRREDEIYIRKYFRHDTKTTNELAILSSLRHEALPRVYQSYELADQTVLIEEYIEGKSLRAYVEEKTKLLPDEAMRLIIQICEIVVFLHAQDPPIIHRDIKPDNIICTDKGVKLIDFNIARTYDPKKEKDTVFMGTVGYAPPEQYGFGQTDTRSDIYALGMTFYFMLTGSEPQRKGDIQTHITGLPDFIQKILLNSARFAPESRYGSVQEMITDVRMAEIKQYEPLMEPLQNLCDYAAEHPLSPAEVCQTCSQHVEKDENGMSIGTPKKSFWRLAGICCAAVLLIVVGVVVTRNFLLPEDPGVETEIVSLDLSNQDITDEALADMVKKGEIPKHITQLNLSSNNIRDITPLASLTNLEELWLTNNPNLSDITSLQEMTQLTILFLRGTQVKDLTPLKSLNQLTVLYLSCTPIEDITPLASLTNMTTLSLMDTKISDITPLQALSKLTILYLIRTPVADVHSLASLTELTDLYLSSTEVRDIAPLCVLSKLTKLNLTMTPVTDLTPLTSLTELTSLEVTLPSDARDLIFLQSLTKLTELCIATPIATTHTSQSPDMTPLISLTGLTKLKLIKHNISDFTFLKSLTGLKILDLSYTSITDAAPLQSLTELTELNLTKTGIRDITFLRHCPQLTSLTLEENIIKDFTPLTDLTALTKLELRDTRISDIACLKTLTNLKHLDLGRNPLRDISLLKELTQLEWLNLDHNPCSDITPLQGLTKLKNLSLIKSFVTDLTPLHSLYNMEVFQASGMDISEEQAHDLQAALPKCAINLNF